MDIPENIIAYTAGLLEKASFFFHKYFRPDNGRLRYWVEIKFTIHSENLAELLHHYWGFNWKKRKDSPNHGISIRSIGAKCEYCIEKTLPYLIEKRNHAIVLAEIGKIRKGIQRGTKLTYKQILKLETLHKVLLTLKDREIKRNGKKWVLMLERRHAYALREIYNNNIFDLFDGSLTMEESKIAKSIFDDLLDKDERKTK